MHNTIESIRNSFRSDLINIATEQDLETVRVKYLGRQGILADLMTQLKDLSADDKKTFGPACNQLKAEFQELKTFLSAVFPAFAGLSTSNQRKIIDCFKPKVLMKCIHSW